MSKKTRQPNWTNPATLQTDIIKRFLKEDTYEKFIEDYRNNRMKAHRARTITPVDRKMYKEWRNGATLSELEEIFGRSRSFVLNAIALVARDEK